MTRSASPFLLLLALLVTGPAATRIGAQAPAPTADAARQPPAAPSGDGWNFADEQEEVPSWAQIVRPQALDLALFTGFLGLALVSFFRKSEKLKTAALIASVVFLGFFKSQLISVVNIFGLLKLNLPMFRFSLFWYLFAGFTLASTVLWGRLYCGRVCAFGALTQLMDKIVPARLRVKVPRPLERRASAIKYVLLGLVVVYFLVTNDISIYRYVEPFWMFSRNGTIAMWIGLATLLVATVFVRNLYCRFLCPVGAFLGLVSNLTVFRIKRWKECNTCKTCEKTCEWGAIRGPRIVATECVRCDDCERLYMDQQRCPHWIVIRRRSDFTARPSGVPAGSGAR